MGYEGNIWGTSKGTSIEDAVTALIDQRQVIRVNQVELKESGKVYRARDGYVLELLVDPNDVTKDEVRVALVGTTVHAYIERAIVAYAGDLAETQAETQAALEAQTAVDELDNLLAGLTAAAPANGAHCASCACALDVRKPVMKLPDGSIHCHRCTVTMPAPCSPPSAA